MESGLLLLLLLLLLLHSSQNVGHGMSEQINNCIHAY
jgi:hypothetical protein